MDCFHHEYIGILITPTPMGVSPPTCQACHDELDGDAYLRATPILSTLNRGGAPTFHAHTRIAHVHVDSTHTHAHKDTLACTRTRIYLCMFVCSNQLFCLRLNPSLSLTLPKSPN